MKIESVNENTCMVYFGDQIGAESAGLVKQASDRLRRDMSDLIIDLVPSYTSILVTWDLDKADRFAITRRVRAVIDADDNDSTGDDSARIVELPVYYDPEVGLDLEDVCGHAGLSRDEVIRIHSEQLYQVYAIGFAPGFAYLGSTDERIAIPRKSTPRLKVPTGSVGIAGTQTAIYPSCTPVAGRSLAARRRKWLIGTATRWRWYRWAIRCAFAPSAGTNSSSWEATLMSFEVLEPGMLALIQDAGRYGYQHMGVTTGGPMDEFAFFWANRLLNNDLNAPQIEITFGRFSLKANHDACIAITGGDLGARINGRAIEPWRTHQISAGDRLDFTAPMSGLRAYLAVSGGFKPAMKLGSCATVSREGLGGIDGQGAKLAKGDRLEFERNAAFVEAFLPESDIPDYQQHLRLGVIPGYQYESFPAVQRMKFFSCDYEISQNIDRMGYRLKGDAIHSDLDGIVSEGIA